MRQLVPDTLAFCRIESESHIGPCGADRVVLLQKRRIEQEAKIDVPLEQHLDTVCKVFSKTVRIRPRRFWRTIGKQYAKIAADASPDRKQRRTCHKTWINDH